MFARISPSVAVVPSELRVMVAEVVIAGVVSAGEVIVCTPVKVFAASVRAIVALVVGNVITVLSVPLKVRVLVKFRVFPAVPVSV